MPVVIKVKKIRPAFTDVRGAISRIMEIDPHIKVALLITSKKGAIRANHYHKHDVHYTYLLSGRFEYWEKSIPPRAKLEKKVIRPGDLVTTPANRIHAMKFNEASIMIVFSTEPRDQDSYEGDTVRVKLV